MEKLRIKIVSGVILWLITSGAYAERWDRKAFAERMEREMFSADQWLVEETTAPLFNLSSDDFLSMSDGLLSRILPGNNIDGDFGTGVQGDRIDYSNDVPAGDGLLPLMLAVLGWVLVVLFRTTKNK